MVGPRWWMEHVSGRPIKPDWRRCLLSAPTGSASSKRPVADEDPAEEEGDSDAEGEIVVAPEYFAEDVFHLEEDRFTADHRIRCCGVEITIPVVDLEFSSCSLCPKELQDILRLSPKESRLQQQVDPQIQSRRREKTQEKTVQKIEQSRLKQALSGFCEELHVGLEQDLQKFTRAESFRRLKLVGKFRKRTRKMAMKAKKKNFLKQDRGVVFFRAGVHSVSGASLGVH